MNIDKPVVLNYNQQLYNSITVISASYLYFLTIAILLELLL